ncbi:MAG: hypothetical protein WAQ52_00165, partial [Terriglobales bacterium]
AVLAPGAVRAQAAAGDPAAPPPVAYASVSELNNILAQVRQTSQNIQEDLSKTRIERWKTDSSTKRQTQANVDSIQRNLQSSLPETIAQLNNAPEDLGASFKLYRNLVLLCDYFSQVLENAGAFGSKDELQTLSNDMTGLESARRSFGERMQNLATAKENELTRLRNQLKTVQAAAPPAPPKKIIVDDTQPPKKPAKKKPAKPTQPAAANPQSAPPTK